MKRALFSLIAALSAASAHAAQRPAPLPFVGCASDGQTGPQPAPKTPAHLPRVTGPAAGRLAYYESKDLGVVAPRGWRCFGLYGSNGSILIVTPEPPGDLLKPGAGLKGSAVQLSVSLADTSGRFEAAEVAARLFPSRKAFALRVMAEGLEPKSSFQFGPFPTDTIRRYGATTVAFETPANTVGMGTKSRLVPNGDPIHGLAMMSPDNDLTVLVVRVPNEQRDLAMAIADAVRKANWPLVSE